MRYLLFMLLTFPAFGHTPNPNWTYEAAIDTSGDTLVSDYSIVTVPANGDFGVAVDAPIKIATPELCTISNPTSWFDASTGARHYLQGQFFNPIESLGTGRWELGYALAADPSGGLGSVHDTVGFCAQYFDSVPAQSFPYDTVYLESWIVEASPSLQASIEFLYPCNSTDCDSCGLIIYCDPPATPTLYDTLTITRTASWPHFYQVEWFIRQLTVTGLMYDTLIYVTEGDTKIAVYKTPVTFTGQSSSGIATVEGWRSGGMDIYCDFGQVITAVDSLEIGTSHIPFSFSWTGFTHETMDTLRIWGVTPEGVHSDTTRISRRYVNTNKGTVRYR